MRQERIPTFMYQDFTLTILRYGLDAVKISYFTEVSCESFREQHSL